MPTINLEKTMPEEFYHESKSGRSHLTKTIFLSSAFVVVFVAGVCGGVWYYQRHVLTNQPVPLAVVPVVEEVPIASSTTPIDSNTLANTSVQWNGNPKLLPDLQLISAYKNDQGTPATDDDYTDANFLSDIKYYEMGMNGASKIILAIFPFQGETMIGYDTGFFFEQSSLDSYTAMSLMSFPGSDIYGTMYDINWNDRATEGYVLSAKVTKRDSNTFYYGITGPSALNHSGIQLEKIDPSISPYLFADINSKNIKKLASLSEGDLYVLTLNDTLNDESNLIYSKQFLLRLPSGLNVDYNLIYSFVSDDYVPGIDWDDGQKNQDAYTNGVPSGGCGSGNSPRYQAAVVSTSSDLKATGKTSDGQLIYEFKDIRHPIVKLFYDAATRYDDSESKLSLEAWYLYHNVILYKSLLGDYIIFSNSKYGPQAECGKPVVYLYPTKTTKVKVQVGADITKSEPNYDKGWQVTAEPSGKLTNADGLTYDSLFWEGLGHGAYPAITEGTIVSQSNLQTTIKAQLTELGLSAKESADFLDFWSDKLPKTPYVRLTWFTTKQMDELAPLFVSPRPDSVIRIFLDFQGYQTKISLPAQKLSAIPRTGFTVIEWGGLLRK